MSRRDQDGVMATGCSADGARGFRVLVLLLVLAVVGWGVGYRATLYSSQSLTSHTVPPARMLAHRACPERGFAVAHKAAQDKTVRARALTAHSFVDTTYEPGLALAVVYRGLSLDTPPLVLRSVTELLSAPRPPPAIA